ncbi:peptide/nickel transport system ATP-binding protein [Sporobacter termitidis DSM 10068]|uniref:Peptide/nickel transport system ATP-binding protein n=1 Tax=Sporobacter termitidis DSM 10068 TaxID=1123282 RepID=A0A1M5WM52_9FIRM|nr:dipeptide/oligopeptide/nickel ABC transporter ATP-binding protein [Sporobacter termitidis]SHH88640.1 peptide/nickel transport system ATP-binding protein [Sporobacter termitidis DSM 10068]
MILQTEKLTYKYPNSHGHTAVDQADISLHKGETVGLFGESGSGKSTLGLILAGLIKPTSGMLRHNGEKISAPYKGAHRRGIQILFQHPEISFNPALILLKSMTEPYNIYALPYSYSSLLEYLKHYGLYEEHLYRTPAQLSGGELQRAALARILAIQPEVIVLDEPTSMLDVITQVQIMNILKDYQSKNNVSYILISHNRILCEKMCGRIYKVENGVFTEEYGRPTDK